MNIRFIRNTEIDKGKWDDCIDKSYNGIIYAYSWYLDIICPNWNALVSDEYRFVMPIPSARKYGINYALQPLYMQQGGIFTPELLNDKILSDFLSAIPKNLKYLHLNFNVFTKPNNDLLTGSQGLTMHLDLIKTYEKILAGYSSNTKRNLKESIKHQSGFVKNINPTVLIDMLSQSQIKGIKKLSKHQLNTLRTLVIECRKRKAGDIYGVTDIKSKISAVAFFAGSHNKIINLANISSPEGYSQKAMFFLFDRYFNAIAGQKITFDFEGSSIPGIARFYKGFGAKPLNFPVLHLNRLPGLLKMFVK